ncbi:MAG: HAD family hydrolase [Alphaproteobacteria bacterium]|nr:HAD family hydrolase [Alphaproteobacteria bacterium]
MSLPFERLEAVFLDVGGTLVTVDHARIASVLAEEGVGASEDQLARAEAAARPALSAAIVASGRPAEGFFALFVRATLTELRARFGIDARHCEAAILARAVPPPGRSDELWRRPVPGAARALARLKEAGFPLVAVSNSDGSAARSLAHAGLAQFFDAVIDSHIVGVAKPDPAIFSHAFAACPAAPERTVYLGDIYAGDIPSARGAGLHAALVDPYGDYGDVDCPTFRDVDAFADALLAGL